MNFARYSVARDLQINSQNSEKCGKKSCIDDHVIPGLRVSLVQRPTYNIRYIKLVIWAKKKKYIQKTIYEK